MGASRAVADDRSSTPIPDRWRPLVAAGLSLLVPGLGHWYSGHRRRALWFFLPSLAFIVVAVVLWAQGETFLLGVLVQPRWVWLVVIANIVMLGIRLAATVDAYRLALPEEAPSWQGRTRLGLAGAAVVLALVPHLIVGVYAAELLDLLTTVFVSDSDVAAASLLAKEEAAARARLAAEQERIDRETAATTTTTAPPTSTTAPTGPTAPIVFGDAGDPELEGFADRTDRVTVLLAGGDGGPGRWSLRTDVMIVATLDLERGTATLMTVQRHLAYFPLPARWKSAFAETDQGVWKEALRREKAGTSLATAPVPETWVPCDCYAAKINGLWTFTNDWTRTYPDVVDPGMEALRETLELAMGIPIHYYALVDMGGFVDLIDAIGGVDVTVREPMHVKFSPAKEGEDWIVINIDPGVVHLDGRLSLAYVRNRSDSNDAVRSRRQRCLLRDAAGQADPYTMVRNFPAISKAIKENTTTNLPLTLLPDLIEVVAGLTRSDIITVDLGPHNITTGIDYAGHGMVDVGKMRSVVAQVMAGEGSAHEQAVSAEECG